jgi:hypothetical protein
MSLRKLNSLLILSKTWPLALNEHFFATLSISFLRMTCFLTLSCSLLSLFFVLLTIHLTPHGKVSGVLTLLYSIVTELLLHHV